MQPGHDAQAPVPSFGPVLRGGRPRDGGPNWRLLGMIFLSLAMSMTVGLGAAAGALVWTGNQSITRKNIAGLQAPQDADRDRRLGGIELKELTTALTILVVGSDSREGLTSQQLRALGTRPEASERTDTIILVRLDPRRNQAALLSFPRDLLVTRCDGSRGRINEAYPIGVHTGIGGPDCLVQTVRALSGIPIDHFVRVDLLGFIKVVDAVGGVSFYLDRPLKDRYAGLDLPAGCVTLNGAQAVGFVRARHLDSDFGRIARQQRFIRELVRKATSLSTLLQPQRLFEIVRSVGQSVETDQNLGLSEMRRIAFAFRDLTVEDVDAWTVPVDDRYKGDAYYADLRQEEADALFQAFRTDQLSPRSKSARPVATLNPEDVPPVHVRNGAGATGLAAAARRVLIQRGFTVSMALNSASVDLVHTKVVYPPDERAGAELVSRALGGAALVPGNTRSPITVIVGADFNLLRLAPPVAPLLPSAPPTPNSVAPTTEPHSASTPSGSDEPQEFPGAMDSNIHCG